MFGGKVEVKEELEEFYDEDFDECYFGGDDQQLGEDEEAIPPTNKKKRGGGRKRKKSLEEETPEEREERRRKTKQKNDRLRAKMTSEQRQAYLDKMEAYRRKKKAEELEVIQKAREMEVNGVDKSVELEEMERRVEERKRKAAEYQRNWRKRKMESDPEHLKDLYKRHNFSTFVKKAGMSEEEASNAKMKRYLYSQAWYAKKGGSGWSALPEDVKTEKKRKMKEWARNLSGDKKQRHQEYCKNWQVRYWEKLKTEDPEKHQEKCDKMRARQKERWDSMTPYERRMKNERSKINAAKKKLKKQLEEEGLGEEMIRGRLEVLWVKMWREFDPNMAEVPPIDGAPRGRPKKDPEPTPPPPSSTVVKEQVEKEVRSGSPQTFQITKQDNHQDDDDSKWNDPSEGPNTAYQLDQDDNDNHHVDDGGYPEDSPTSSDASRPPSPEEETSTDVYKAVSPEMGTEVQVECPHCLLVLRKGDPRLHSHVLVAHPEKCGKCPHCSHLSVSSQELFQHFQKVHKRGSSSVVTKEEPESQLPFICMVCPTPRAYHADHLTKGWRHFRTRQELFDHVKTDHIRNYWPCENCNLLKYSDTSLRFHQTICVPPASKGSKVNKVTCRRKYATNKMVV